MDFINWLESQAARRFNYNKKPVNNYIDDYGDDIDNDNYERLQYEPMTTHNLSDEDINKSYDQYHKAMGRRRDGSQLDKSNYFDYLGNDVKVVREGDSFAFGHIYNGVFIPSHFAPKNTREGVRLIEKLKNMNSALLVPEDLSQMAERIGFHVVKKDVPAMFRGQIVLKNLLVSNQNLVDKVLQFIEN